ncbi:glycosyltransferase family 2 protein [Kocuria sp. M1R5S2]|uniref:glycosyltransferase family 2 protein n=1 Tax=Kocuria rhizosphaerae TaxID=3376285 RepID=UPI0037B62F90
MSSPASPLVDVVVPVHSTTRPVGRAVASVVAGGLPVAAPDAAPRAGAVRITVVCHNIGAEPIRDCLRPEHRSLVELVEWADDTTNPAGARNLGLERSTGRYVSFLDSDDALAPGALAAWVRTAERHGSDAVLPPLVRDTGRPVRTPVPRPLRRADLDPVRDRLAYRTHAFGLLRRAALLRVGARFDGGHATGEDQEFVARTWFGGGRLDLAPRAAAYVLHEGAADRISGAARPLAADLAAACGLLGGSWFAGLEEARRTAIAAKVLRVQFFAAVQARSGQWSPEDARACREFTALVGSVAAPALEVLSRADRDVLELAVRPDASAAGIAAASARRRRFGRPATLLTRDPRRLLHREAPPRFMAASLMV